MSLRCRHHASIVLNLLDKAQRFASSSYARCVDLWHNRAIFKTQFKLVVETRCVSITTKTSEQKGRGAMADGALLDVALYKVLQRWGMKSIQGRPVCARAGTNVREEKQIKSV